MKNFFSPVFVLALFLAIAACTKIGPQIDVPAQEGKKSIALEASSFEFSPNNLKANQGDEILFDITNRSEKVHNFTLKNPDGKTVQDIDLPPKKNIQVSILFSQPGIYRFYCDKPFHAMLGMEGRIQIIPGRAR